jgi:DNA-binding LacI/PurR family transcriptional regulator
LFPYNPAGRNLLTGKKRSTNHVTLLDVARASGFSASTVSIVLNNAPLSRYVAAATKERIREAAHALGYYPDAFARSLRRRRSNTIGLMAFDLSDPFCTPIVRGAQTQLNDTRFLPLLMDAQNQRKQFEAYLKLLLERRVEGLIVVANWIFAGFQFLSDIEKNNVPVVVVDRDLTASNIHSVLVDNEAGGYMAIEHLHRLGHTRIAVIRGPGELADSDDRWAGILRYASESGLRLDPRLVRQLPDAIDPSSSFEGGLRLTSELLRKNRKIDFTALVAFDDLTALGAIRALFHAGRRVPEDCSVIGFDDILPAAVSSPAITTIRQPMETMGQIAASWIMEAIEADEKKDAPPATAPRLQLLEPALIVRESTSRYKTFQ